MSSSDFSELQGDPWDGQSVLDRLMHGQSGSQVSQVIRGQSIEMCLGEAAVLIERTHAGMLETGDPRLEELSKMAERLHELNRMKPGKQ